jgi:glucuronoarabinoxylan endo-1,4-beta-xylanase
MRISALGLALSSVVACSESRESRERVDVRTSALAPEVVIDPSDEHQTITGFGASSAWTSPSLGLVKAEQFFSTENGIGLSLVRLRIAPDGTTWETATALDAQARGAAVWAAPWSPPGEWKSNGDAQNGGRLLPEHYQDWADRLADFVENIEAAGVRLLALSAQNEPDWVAEWETCEWTPTELATFIGDYLGPTLAARGLSTKILGPESANWTSFPGYSDAIFANPNAAAAVDILATHAYGGVTFEYKDAADRGKEFWQTEVSWGEYRDDGMDNALMMARMMHEHLTLANVNAWHFWWMQPDGGTSLSSSTLYNAGSMTRRGYVLGNFSRFVRPGSVRVGVSPEVMGDVQVTAFKNAGGGPIAIVATNSDLDTPQPFQFRLNGVTREVGSVTPWVTDETRALAAQAPVAVSGGVFEYELPPRSAVTFVSAAAPPSTGGTGGSDTGGAGGGSAATGGTGGALEGGAPNLGGDGGDDSGGAVGGSVATGGKPSGGSHQVDDGPEPLPVTPSVECLCRATGGGTAPPSPGAWLPVAGLLAVLAQRRLGRRHAV